MGSRGVEGRGGCRSIHGRRGCHRGVTAMVGGSRNGPKPESPGSLLGRSLVPDRARTQCQAPGSRLHLPWPIGPCERDGALLSRLGRGGRSRGRRRPVGQGPRWWCFNPIRRWKQPDSSRRDNGHDASHCPATPPGVHQPRGSRARTLRTRAESRWLPRGLADRSELSDPLCALWHFCRAESRQRLRHAGLRPRGLYERPEPPRGRLTLALGRSTARCRDSLLRPAGESHPWGPGALTTKWAPLVRASTRLV